MIKKLEFEGNKTILKVFIMKVVSENCFGAIWLSRPSICHWENKCTLSFRNLLEVVWKMKIYCNIECLPIFFGFFRSFDFWILKLVIYTCRWYCWQNFPSGLTSIFQWWKHWLWIWKNPQARYSNFFAKKRLRT